jgi:hypothetical protein
MIINLNASGIVMIVFLVYVVLLAVKDSSTKNSNNLPTFDLRYPLSPTNC